MNGIVLLSDQDNGGVYALDLKPDRTYDLVGRYELPTGSTRGLELDRSTGLLNFVDGSISCRSWISSSNLDHKDDSGRAILWYRNFAPPVQSFPKYSSKCGE